MEQEMKPEPKVENIKINLKNAKKIRKKERRKLRNLNLHIDYSFVKILTGSDLSTRKLPVMSLKSVNPGPVVWITGCIHGDEVGGVVVIQEIFKRILKKRLLKGTLYAFPVMNPSGFETGSHSLIISSEITPYKVDINRSFPGDPNGSLAERIADKIFQTIKKTEPSLVLDLHNDWRKSIAYSLIDPPQLINKDIYEKTKNFARMAGFPLVLDTDELTESLTYTLLLNGIPSLTLELGEAYAVNETDVEQGVRAIWNVLHSMGMVDGIEENYTLPKGFQFKNRILKYSEKPVSSSSGIIRFLVKPGEQVKKNQPIAKIYNAFGKLLETINAHDDALVLGYSDYPVAFPGSPLMEFGVI